MGNSVEWSPMTPSEEWLRERLVSLRLDFRRTKRDVAKGLGMNEVSYARIESGQIRISYSHLVGLCRVYEISMAALLGYQFVKDPSPAVLMERGKESPVSMVLGAVARMEADIADMRDRIARMSHGEAVVKW